MWPVTLTYFCYGWSLWLYLNWLPLFFKNNYNLDIKNSALFASGVFFAGVVGDTSAACCRDRILNAPAMSALARLQRHRCGISRRAAVAVADPVRPRHHDRRAVPVGAASSSPSS